ncbi:MAG: cytochrome c biogenesis heme-transporting ATPase CcmA [Proteobacteria bacterium]|nr:cytochrome c biogenesis heme-transporting ATPase CcmA [Pseudomonadota bacterium]
MTDPALEVHDLHLWRGEHHLLRGIGFSLASGQFLRLSGANGAGKTSLLRTLCGLIWPEQGTVRWRGADVHSDLRAFHAEMVYLGHEPPLKADLTARENLRYWVGLRRAVTCAELDRALTHMGVMECGDRPVRQLSAGQRRRIALAGLSLLPVALWLLDEPTTNLDAQGEELVAQLIAGQLARGAVVVAALHRDLPQTPMQAVRLELAA